MIRTFEIKADDETFDLGDRVDMTIRVDDSEVGLTMTVEGKVYRLRDQAVSELKEILAQVKPEENPFT
jgi:tartrate dehydratase beta subunit/fumarate hydratase class I family protein